ncbi:OmpA family protein [Robertkochia aurantiaca]|uniref:OmpA family protein n=1 Tax=Robertkochia aurantiaca TaxID=2873700 RepID=UPI001CC98FF3|nr:OmpA family protein [Robertkochia sp. 3YJGBD-33]
MLIDHLRKWGFLIGIVSIFSAEAQSAGEYVIFGVGANVIDDSGSRTQELFNTEENWNVAPYPSRFSAGYQLSNGLSIEMIGRVNNYKEGKVIDGAVIAEDRSYFGLDANLSYHLNRLFNDAGWFDPFLLTGLGYTWLDSQAQSNFDTGLGLNMWLGENIAVNLNTVGKWSINASGTNYLQHAVGIIFKPALFSKSSRTTTIETDEEDDLAQAADQGRQLEIQEPKDQPVAPNDSNTQKTAVTTNDNSRVKEEDRSAFFELEAALNSLPRIYFDLNSSYMNAEDMRVLDQLVTIMKQNSGMIVQVQAYADERGNTEYNEMLSKKRAERVVDYVVSNGIEAERIYGVGKGELELSTPCENADCEEAVYRKSRRVDYILIKI